MYDQLPLSIIVPVFKAEKFLPACLDSILSQTFTDFELILIDDGSPDNSGKICDEYALKDTRVKVIHKMNGGASTARNAGVEAAQGKYIGWVDADDYISPVMYATLHSLAENYNADIAECQYMLQIEGRSTRSGVEEPVVYGTDDFILKQFFTARMNPGLTTKIYKKELWNGIHFPVGRKHQDCYVNMRFALMPLRYVRTADPLYYYVVRENSITTTLTASEIRQAIYLYDYTMELASADGTTDTARKFLVKDAINRLIGRYFEVSVNSCIPDLYVYNRYLWRKLGLKLIKYLLSAKLPFKTKVSYSLLLLNLKKMQKFLHDYLGKK